MCERKLYTVKCCSSDVKVELGCDQCQCLGTREGGQIILFAHSGVVWFD